MLLSPKTRCRTAQSASCPQSLPCHFLVCSERCKAERVPVREVTGSATGCRGEEFPHLLLHVCWTLFRGEGHVWAIGSFTLQVFQRQTLIQSSWWVGKGENNIMKPMWPYLWSLAQVNKLMEAGVGSEWSYVKRSYGSSWKLGDLESLLWCITLEECISHVSTAADLLFSCSLAVLIVWQFCMGYTLSQVHKWMVWYTGCSSALEAQIPRGVQCPWHGGLPRTGQFWGHQFPSVLPSGIGFLSDCSFEAQSYLSPLWVFRVASKPPESVRLCVEPFPRGCLCLSLPSPTSGTSRYTCYMLIGFQSPFLCVLGASGHAGNLGWCVVSGQCDLWAWGEQWVCKSEWSLTGMAEGCSGEWQELIETYGYGAGSHWQCDCRSCSCFRVWRLLKNKQFVQKCSVWPRDCVCVHCYSCPERYFPASLSCVSRTRVLHMAISHVPCWYHTTQYF